MKKCRITVMRMARYDDLIEKFENNIEHACDLKEGQVFVTQNGSPMHPDTLTSWFGSFIKTTDLPQIHIHSLRHTNATVMASLGLVDKAVMARGGWSSDRVLKDVYEHLFTSSKTDADKAINDYFEAAVPNLHTDLHTKK